MAADSAQRNFRTPPRDGTPTVFHTRKWLTRIYLILGVGLMVQGILTAGYFLAQSSTDGAMRWLMIAIALFLVWLGYWFAAGALRRIRRPDVPIVIGPDGLHDRVLFTRDGDGWEKSRLYP